MTMLKIGLILWIVAHLFKRVMPRMRQSLDTMLGEGPMRGLMSVLILASIVLMVIGYRSVPEVEFYATPKWAPIVTNVLMLVAVALLGMGSSKGRARSWLRHPMLAGIIVWSTAHLVSNGSAAAVMLFSGMIAWAIISMVMISGQEGEWDRPEPGPASGDIKWLVISAVIFAVIVAIHTWFGPAPFGGLNAGV